jgi:hypothetical protein
LQPAPASISPPSPLARMHAWLLACRAAEEAREAERRVREGAAYKTPGERAEAARAARAAAAAEGCSAEEARVLEKRFDPARDYYQLLGIARRVHHCCWLPVNWCLLHSLLLLLLLLKRSVTVPPPAGAHQPLR